MGAAKQVLLRIESNYVPIWVQQIGTLFGLMESTLVDTLNAQGRLNSRPSVIGGATLTGRAHSASH
jgi:hypothetical protein